MPDVVGMAEGDDISGSRPERPAHAKQKVIVCPVATVESKFPATPAMPAMPAPVIRR